jgi:hypothetical protein
VAYGFACYLLVLAAYGFAYCAYFSVLVFHIVIKHTHHLDQSHIGQTIIYGSFYTLPQILFHVNHDVKHQQKDSSIGGGHIINHAKFSSTIKGNSSDDGNQNQFRRTCIGFISDSHNDKFEGCSLNNYENIS